MDRRRFLRDVIGGGAVAAIGLGAHARLGAAQGDQQWTVNVDRLNVRSSPGLGGAIVAVLSRGTIVSLAGGTQWADGYEWVKIAVWSSGTGGWVASSFLGGASSGSPFAPGSTVYVAVSRLNLRSGAGTGYPVVRAYGYGYTGTVTGNGVRANGYLWVPVRMNDGTSGWFASELLHLGGSQGPKDRIRVAQGPLRVRSKPSLDGSVLWSAPVGAYADILDGPVSANGYTWLKVKFDSSGVTGWLAREFVSYIQVA